MKSFLGLYRHYKGNHYNVVGVARSTDNPKKKFVVYEQLYTSINRDDSSELPIGTLWIREYDEFNGYMNGVKRFERIDRKKD